MFILDHSKRHPFSYCLAWGNVSLLLLLLRHDGLAQTYWNAGASDWYVATNWTSGVPNATTDARIDNGGTSQIFATGATARDIRVGDAVTGNLEIASGVTLSNRAGIIGNLVGSQGTVTVAGANAKWKNSSTLDVGTSGTATLNISNGASVSNTAGMIGRNAGASGIVTVTGMNSTWSNSGGLIVGSNGQGVLHIENAGLVSVPATTTIGQAGTIVFDGGTLTTWNLSGDLGKLSGTGIINTNGLNANVNLIFDQNHGLQQQLVNQSITINLDANGKGNIGIGNRGAGSLSIMDGLTVPCQSGSVGSGTGANGFAVVSGTGSTWKYESGMSVGSTGQGELIVQNGGKILSTISGNSFCHIGRSGNGKATITGSGSTWNAQTLTLAESGDGQGELTISDGGAVLLNIGNGKGTIGGSGHGKVTVTGNGSRWVNSSNPTWDDSGTLYVGYSGGVGELTIADGGLVDDTFGAIAADFSASTGNVTVTGTDSLWRNSRDLYVGGRRICCSNTGNNGTLLIDAGATVSNTDAFIGFSSNSTGTVTVQGPGSAWNSTGQVTLGDTGRGVLKVMNGGVVAATGGIHLKVGGTLSGDSSVVANIFNDGGAINPGASVGTLQVNGNFTQGALGTMNFEIGGSGIGQADLLNVSGVASLAGTLHVSLSNGFIPNVGETFTVLTGQSLINNGLTLTGAYAGMFQLDFSASSIALRVVNAGSPGDFNLDGEIDAADFVVWRENKGSQLEYDAWRANFGTRSSNASFESVPEPSALLLVVAVANALPWLRMKSC